MTLRWLFVVGLVGGLHALDVAYQKVQVPDDSAICNVPILMVAKEDSDSSNRASVEYQLEFDIVGKKSLNASNPSGGKISILIFVSDSTATQQESCLQMPSKSMYPEKTLTFDVTSGGATTAKLTESADEEIVKTGFHILYIANTYPFPITFSGKVGWTNPFGQLSADLYGFLPFYKYLCVAMLIVGVLWAVRNFMYRGGLLVIQHCLSVMTIVCIVEFGSWYLYYWNLNDSGSIDSMFLVFVLLLTVLRRTISRVLVVAVAMGFGVVKPTLPKSSQLRLAVVGFVYFIAESTNEIMMHYSPFYEVNVSRFLLVAPSTILNAVFYWWIFTSLSTTLEELKESNQTSKLTLYENFSRVLAGSLAAATVMAVYTIVWISFWTSQPWMWSQRWFVENGFWQLLYVVILVSVMILWMPSPHQREIAHHIQISQTDDDDELEMTIQQLENDKTLDFDDDEEELNGDMFSIEDEAEDEPLNAAK